MKKVQDLTVCNASQEIISSVQEIETVWDRYEKILPQCKFGTQGICCRICLMGPCRVSSPKVGVCGATEDIVAARNLARMAAAGVASHSDHGRDVAHTLLSVAKGTAQVYKVKDREKLLVIAQEYGIKIEGRNDKEIAYDVAKVALSEFGQQEGELKFTKRAPKKRQEIWRSSGIMPRGIDREVVEIMHRTHMGVDNDYENIMKQTLRAALADGWGGSMIATEISDILFGMPKPIRAQVNLGVLQEDYVNILVHGHEPTLSDIIVDAVNDPELVEYAKSKGAKGILLGGICCTANEILMRHGIPIVGNFLQQELAILTGAVEVMVVDVQCVFPALGNLVQCFHTKLVSTSPKAKFPFATYVEFKEEKAFDVAKQIVRIAIDNYPYRDKNKVKIPKWKFENLVAGFTAESVFSFLGGKYRSTYRPLNDAIITGRIRGAAGIVGCNNPKQIHDYCHVTLTKELLKKDVLVVTTGCSAIANAKAGLLMPEALEYCGKGLREVCEAVGIPPVLHLGACVDNSRILITLCNVINEGGLGEDFSDLPVVGVAPEWMSEKAIAIAFYVVGSGITTFLGNPFPILGAKKLTKFLTEDIENIVGAKFVFESDPIKIAEMIIDILDEKREKLHLKPMMYS